ncbi:MAG: hypothetical protein O7G85_08565 [Planctomycetota bacterium]|nr:hypothetical protein [Planctomycetota bacterium]
MSDSLKETRKPPVVKEEGDAVLHQFLADQDAPCPACGYNLRNLAKDNCPECGQAIKLHLQPAGPMAKRSGLILLVFLWLLVSSSVQGWGVGSSMYARITNPFSRFMTISLNGNILFTPPSQINLPTFQMQQSPSRLLAPTPSIFDSEVRQDESTLEASEDFPDLLENEAQTDELAQALDSVERLITTSAPSISRNSSISIQMPSGQVIQPFGSPRRYNWGAVSWKEWTQMGVWTMLGMLALAGFILLGLVRRSSEPSSKLLGSIPILAWSGFGIFCVMHLVSSVFGLI